MFIATIAAIAPTTNHFIVRKIMIPPKKARNRRARVVVIV
jgi:hypothetical protein